MFAPALMRTRCVRLFSQIHIQTQLRYEENEKDESTRLRRHLGNVVQPVLVYLLVNQAGVALGPDLDGQARA